MALHHEHAQAFDPMKPHFRFEFTFPKNYEVRKLESAPLPHPVEKLYQYPAEIEEGDRSGTYLRVVPGVLSGVLSKTRPAWTGFFALGFDSDQVVSAVCSCPDPDSLCAVAGGYAYVVNATDPAQWFRIEQRPVVDLRALHEQQLLLFTGFTTISALGLSGLAWTTKRLSWEGITIAEISGEKLQGTGWDAIADKEVPFEVDLLTGKHTGGAGP